MVLERWPEAHRTIDDIREHLLPLVGDGITAMCLSRSNDPLGFLIDHLSQARAGLAANQLEPLQVSTPQWGAPARARRARQASAPVPPQPNEVSELVRRVVQRAEGQRQQMSETQRRKTNAVGEAWRASNWLEARGTSRSISDALLGPLLAHVKADKLAVDETLEIELVKVRARCDKGSRALHCHAAAVVVSPSLSSVFLSHASSYTPLLTRLLSHASILTRLLSHASSHTPPLTRLLSRASSDTPPLTRLRLLRIVR